MAKGTSIFTNQDSRTWIQDDGLGTAFTLYACHAVTEWSRDYGETVYVKCKSPDEYARYQTVRTIHGEPMQPTFTVQAYTQQEADYLLGLQCPVDIQTHLGFCSSPGDPTGYEKIRHFYRAWKTSESESNLDYIGEETGAGVELTVEFTAEEVIEILEVALETNGSGVTETQAFNDIAMLVMTRCEGDCGVEISEGEWGVAVADADYLSATANVWYTQDSGGTWSLAATDPFADNGANCGAVVIISGETTPRIIVFRGNVSGLYGARASISDDWGATWSEVDMGGNLNGSWINGAFAYSSGLIIAVGNGGYLYYSQDRGASWTEQTNATTGTSNALNDVHTIDADTVYAVGDNNTVIRSTDGMTSWSSLTGPADGTENLLTVQSPTEYRVFVGGQRDASEECLWVSNDRGAAWAVRAFTGSTTAGAAVVKLRITRDAPLAHMVMIHGTGSSDRCFRTLDGSGSWERLSLLANSGYNSLSVVDVNTAFICGEAHGGIALIHKMAATT